MDNEKFFRMLLNLLMSTAFSVQNQTSEERGKPLKVLFHPFQEVSSMWLYQTRKWSIMLANQR